MTLRSGMNAPAVLIEKYINTAYDNIKLVANNLTEVTAVGEYISNPNNPNFATLADAVTISADAAAASAVDAAASAVTSEASAVNSALSAAASEASFLSLSGEVQEAQDWANKLAATVDGNEYSSKHYSQVADGFATASALSAASAASFASVGFDVASALYDFGLITDASLTFTTDYGTVV